ncbi:hypothetical protein PoB_002102100 [Plakobranchus ocellatus]|uniref:Uncharacterized protein n=1 Tax=Plakobranchus ocellatus TaxID=259542 RepID=A0AAV3ZF30_9GAST|nr:hypothetical protein PoB_002102100 [Plakobranchus ocellatus]
MTVECTSKTKSTLSRSSKTRAQQTAKAKAKVFRSKAEQQKVYIVVTCVAFSFTICNVDSSKTKKDCHYNRRKYTHGSYIRVANKPQKICKVYQCADGITLYYGQECYYGLSVSPKTTYVDPGQD